MTDEELVAFNRSGFIPGPLETESQFLQRVESTKSAYFKLGVSAIPKAHWAWADAQLNTLFDFTPTCLPAFYSNTSLTPWQGAAAWVERGQVIAIQLRESFKKGSFLGMYDRGELLAHESVHAARSAFPKDPWDEFFAYMTSQRSWRRVLGPIIQNPWEVWPLFVLCLLSAVLKIFFLGVAIWVGMGFSRLIRRHRILRKASDTLRDLGYSDEKARSLLLRLTDAEIRNLSKGINIFSTDEMNLRWRLIRCIYR